MCVMTTTIPYLPTARVQLLNRVRKESKVKLTIQVGDCDGVTLVRCRGRITFGVEALALGERVAQLLPSTQFMVLDLSGVDAIDSAGLGELVMLYMRTKASRCELKLAAPRPGIWDLLQLTNLTSVLQVCSTVNEAIASLRERVA